MKKSRILKLISLLFLIILVSLIIASNTLLKADGVKVVEKDSLITIQTKLQNQYIPTKDFNDMEIVLDPYDNAPLTAIALFVTDDDESVTVTVNGKNPKTTYTHTFAETKNHYIPILGLYADTLNKVTIETSTQTKEVEIQTAALPNDLAVATSISSDLSLLSDDLFFYTPSNKGYTTAYDVNGDVRWYLSANSIFTLDRLQNGHFLISTDSLLQQPYYMTGLYEIDMLGKVYTQFSISSGYHHDFQELENGNLLVLSNNPDTTKVEDYIVELDRNSGEVVKKFDISKIVDYDEGKNVNWTSDDWFHNNSIFYDKYSNSILVSGRHNDSVISFDYDTEQINWILGSPENWSDKYLTYFLKPIGNNFEYQWGQHDIQVYSENNLSLFDNGNEKSKTLENAVTEDGYYSRGVTYHIDPVNMTVEQTFEYGKERGKNFYSPYISSMEVLGTDHYLIGSLGIGFKDNHVVNGPAVLVGADEFLSDTVELLNNKIIFEMKLPNNNFRVKKFNLYNNQEYTTNVANKLGTIEKTEPTTTKFGLKPEAIEINDTYSSRKIEFIKDEDRLEMVGIYKDTDSIELILYTKGTILSYDVMANEVDTKAGCVAVFTTNPEDGMVDITAHINETGLSGNYEIFVKINGQVFDPNLQVVFD